MSYRIRYAAETQEHLASLTARQRSTVLEGITRQLREQPLVESRNRKRMRRPSLATWELRLGDLGVFDNVDTQEETVWVLAVGVKLRERLRIGREVIDL